MVLSRFFDVYVVGREYVLLGLLGSIVLPRLCLTVHTLLNRLFLKPRF